MTSYLIVDLDGPVLDTRRRHHWVHRHAVAELGGTPLDLDTFWARKRRRVTDSELASSTGVPDAAALTARVLELIESEEALLLDRVQPGARDALERARSRAIPTVLVTMRQSQPALDRQLARLDLTRLFDTVARCDRGAPKAQSLLDAVEPAVPAPNSMWVGDTEVDVEAARHVGCAAVAVTCGIRERELLADLRPDELVASLGELDLAPIAG